MQHASVEGQRTRIDGLLSSLGCDSSESSNHIPNLDSLIYYILPLFGDSTDETPLPSFFTRDPPVGEYQIHGPGFSNHFGESLGSTSSGDDAEGDFRLTKLGVGGRDQDIGHQG
jgi:hypothetical protein